MQAVCRGYWQNYQTDSELVLEVTEIHEDVTLLRSSLWKQRIYKAGIHDGLFLIIRNVAIIDLPLSKLSDVLGNLRRQEVSTAPTRLRARCRVGPKQDAH